MTTDVGADVGADVGGGVSRRVRAWLAAGRPPLAVIAEPNSAALARWGLPDDATGTRTYAEILAEAVAGVVALVKIQPAAFERFGPDGWAALRTCIAALAAAGADVLIDAKRTDHAPVLRSLVATYVGPGSSYGAHGLTVLPWLGSAEISEAAAAVGDRGGLLLVVAQTSNGSADLVQQARTADGRTVAEAVVDAVSAHNRGPAGRDELGIVAGGPARTAAPLVARVHGIAVVPGWGRPNRDPRELLSVRAAAPDRVLLSIGSRLTAEGARPAELRRFLLEQARTMQSDATTVDRFHRPEPLVP